MAGVVAFLGVERALFAIFIGSLMGIVLVILRKNLRETYVPFTPFLSSASFIIVFIPQNISLIDVIFALETKILGI